MNELANVERNNRGVDGREPLRGAHGEHECARDCVLHFSRAKIPLTDANALVLVRDKNICFIFWKTNRCEIEDGEAKRGAGRETAQEKVQSSYFCGGCEERRKVAHEE